MVSKSTREILAGYYNLQTSSLCAKHQTDSPIYKHIAIKRRMKEIINPPKQELMIAPKSEQSPNKRSLSYYTCRACEKLKDNAAGVTSKPAQGDLALLNSVECPKFVLSSEIKVGVRVAMIEKTQILKKICETVLGDGEDRWGYKYFFNERDRIFNVLPVGEAAPVSECCNSSIVIQVSEECGGKVVCPQRNCFIRCLSNFFIDKVDKELLWPMISPKKGLSIVAQSCSSKRSLASLREKVVSAKNSIFFTPTDRFANMISPLNKLIQMKNRKLLG